MTKHNRSPITDYRLLFSILLIISCFSACQIKRELTLEELKTYPLDPKNGLYKKDETGSVLVEVIYRPKDIIIDLNTEGEDQESWNRTEAELKEYDYFVLRLSKQNKEIETHFAGDAGAYTNIVNYLSGGISSDIVLLVDNEEIPVSDVLFAPSYGMTTASSILLVFQSNLESKKNNFKIVFQDTQFGTGRHEFQFDYDDIRKVPALKR